MEKDRELNVMFDINNPKAYAAAKKNSDRLSREEKKGYGKKIKKSNTKKKVVSAALIFAAGAAFMGAFNQSKIVLQGRANIINNARESGFYDDIIVYDNSIYRFDTALNGDGEVFLKQVRITREEAQEYFRTAGEHAGLNNVEGYIVTKEAWGDTAAEEIYGQVTLEQVINECTDAYYEGKVMDINEERGLKR